MGYSSEALAFSTIPPSHQVRLEDRVSFLYLDYCLIRQDRTGVVAIQCDSGSDCKDDSDGGHRENFVEKIHSVGDELYNTYDNEQLVIRRIQIPVAGVGVLCLGPGTTISNAAITSCARSGCSIIFSGTNGVNMYASATPLTSSARWAIAQAKLWASEEQLVDAAIQLYQRQFGASIVAGKRIQTMRGMEGRLMRNVYREEAKKARITNFKRDTKGNDIVNMGLNVANSIMYGVAATACAAIGINPALGIIHRGDIRSLLYDLADLYKARVVIPLVFRHAHDDDPIGNIRRELRERIHREKVMQEMLGILMEILKPYLPTRNDDRLIDDNGEVSGHTQY